MPLCFFCTLFSPEHRDQVARHNVLFLQCMTRRVLAVMYRTVLRRCHTRIAEAIRTRTSHALVPALAHSRAVGGLRLFLFRRGEEVLKVVQREGTPNGSILPRRLY